MTVFKKTQKILMLGIANIIFCSAIFASQSTLPKAPYISPQKVKQWQERAKKFIFVDVREPEEYHAGHLEGAINIPYANIEEHADEFRNDQSYVFYCIHSSWRAPYSANVLADLGLQNIYVLEGGISAWNAGGQVIYATKTGRSPQVAPYPSGLKKSLKHLQDEEYEAKISLTKEELKIYDGQEGRPAYVAIEGVIYDVTKSRLWRGGVHDPGHGEVLAGNDLTELLEDSPHGIKNLKRFPIVGRVIRK